MRVVKTKSEVEWERVWGKVAEEGELKHVKGCIDENPDKVYDIVSTLKVDGLYVVCPKAGEKCLMKVCYDMPLDSSEVAGDNILRPKAVFQHLGRLLIFFPLISVFPELDESLIRHVLYCTCEALSNVHKSGWVHGNVNKGHVVLSSNGVKLTPFDIGFLKASKRAPPEHLEDQKMTPAADVWSLGIMAITMADQTQIELPAKPKLTKKWSREFRDFVSCCLKKVE